MNRLNRSKRGERGQSMIELALSISVLMVLLAGTIDLGRAFFAWLAMRDAAQEGASYASFHPADSTGIDARVRSTFADMIKDPSAIVTVGIDYSGPLCLDDPQSIVTVNVEYQNFPITMPFLGALIGDTVIIRATINDAIILPLCN